METLSTSIFWLIGGGIISAFLTFFFVKIFVRYKILDFPEKYGLRRMPVPYPLGIAFVLGSMGVVLMDAKFWPLLLFSMILGILSFIDDRRNIPALLRLLVHIALVFFLFYQGFRIFFISDPFHATNFALYEFSPLVSVVITVVWVVSIQNAMNWFDGTPGLTPSVSGIGFLILGILGLFRPELFYDPSHATVTFLSFYLAGLCFGMVYFLWRKKGILGDTGSQVMGGLLAVTAIASGAKIATTVLVLILPLLDFIFVIFRRIFWEKVSPFQGDKKHLHHLLQKSIGGGKTFIILALISLIFGVFAVFFSGIVKFILIIAGVFVFFVWRIWISRFW
jgi:UDP-GlcNAc:undecaprenyl-phosphate GlcNAc-1-phosphate transferase